MNRLTILLFAATVLALAAPANALIGDWEAAATSDSPGFLATNIADGVYDIGALSGDITYEFVVMSNLDEAEASMCLIGRRGFGDMEAGLKYEQRNNTGTYGATVFGVADYDYGVANSPGVDTHLVFVSSAGETALYVNGVYQASVATEIALSGVVGIGYGAQAEDGSDSFDNFDGDILGVAIYDAALSADVIAAHSDEYFYIPPSDVTGPGDFVKGVPDDGDWPGGEHPALAIDNNTGTKYLHFKGDFDAGDPLMGAGIQITPADGESLVSGITFTTANDAPERDPAVYALYGSNTSIDGPYELISCGYIDDFVQDEAWPRFTKNETEIMFDNDVPYEHYQLQFIDIRDISSANSMQIAEIELMGIKLDATNLVPADGAISLGIDDDLSWKAGSRAISHDVYIGAEFPLPFAGNMVVDNFDPGVLEYSTTYYWRVDAVEEDGTVRTGAVSSFTTTTPVGPFEYTQDIGGPAGIGRTTYEGYVWKNDTLSDQYRVMGGGADIAGSNDQFHFAYNRVSGNVRISASFEWVTASDDWAKMGVMLRAGSDGDDISHSNVTRKDSAIVHPQHRNTKGGGNGGPVINTDPPIRLGIQRITAEGLTWIQSLADFGNGWESMEVVRTDNLPDVMLAGICVTSHNDNHLVQARATDITYELNPELVGDLGIPKVPADADLGAPPTDVSGFSIRSLKPLVSADWGYDAMNSILDTGMWNGLPAMPGSEGTRIDEFVNLYDTGAMAILMRLTQASIRWRFRHRIRPRAMTMTTLRPRFSGASI